MLGHHHCFPLVTASRLKSLCISQIKDQKTTLVMAIQNPILSFQPTTPKFNSSPLKSYHLSNTSKFRKGSSSLPTHFCSCLARTKLEAEIGNDEDVAGPQEAKLKHMSGAPRFGAIRSIRCRVRREVETGWICVCCINVDVLTL